MKKNVTQIASHHRKLKFAKDRIIAYTNTLCEKRDKNRNIEQPPHHITENSNSQGIASSHIWTHYMKKCDKNRKSLYNFQTTPIESTLNIHVSYHREHTFAMDRIIKYTNLIYKTCDQNRIISPKTKIRKGSHHRIYEHTLWKKTASYQRTLKFANDRIIAYTNTFYEKKKTWQKSHHITETQIRKGSHHRIYEYTLWKNGIASSNIRTYYIKSVAKIASYHRKLKFARDRIIAYTNTLYEKKRHHITEHSNSQWIVSLHIWTHSMKKCDQNHIISPKTQIRKGSHHRIYEHTLWKNVTKIVKKNNHNIISPKTKIRNGSYHRIYEHTLWQNIISPKTQIRKGSHHRIYEHTIWKNLTKSHHITEKLEFARDRIIAYMNTLCEKTTENSNPQGIASSHIWTHSIKKRHHITENSNSQGIASSHIWTQYMKKRDKNRNIEQPLHHITESSNSQGIASSHIWTHNMK